MRITSLYRMITIYAVAVLAVTIPSRGWTQSVPAISDDVVRIGLLLDMSGPYADITGKGSETAARMAVEDFGGKVLGNPIEVIAADQLNKPDVAAEKAREWFDASKVDALMDVVGSSSALAVQEIARARHKVVMLNAPASTQLINEACAPNSVLYTYTTYAIAHTVGQAAVKQGGNSWFFITADYAFGVGLERDTSAVVKAAGGKVLGSIRHPLNTNDFSSFLLQAQASGAKVIGLANAGTDMINTVKQAAEFGIDKGGQNLAGLVVLITDVHSLGLAVAKGMVLSESFYWDLDENTRAWSKRFFERIGRMPTMLQAGVYSSTLHYLKAIQVAGKDEGDAVSKAMRSMPVNDFFAHNGRIREDGLMVHDMYLFQVKSPTESKEPWDYYKLLATIPGDQAFPPLAASQCPLVKK
jgi:branched-chain amino acid transport system substrate-binding protein